MKRDEILYKPEGHELNNKSRTRLLILADEDIKKTRKNNSPVKINSKNFSECAQQYESIVVNLVEQTFWSSTNLNKGIKKISSFQSKPKALFTSPDLFSNDEKLLRKSSISKKKIRKSTKNLINVNLNEKLFNFNLKNNNDVKFQNNGEPKKSKFSNQIISPQSKIKRNIVEGFDYLQYLSKKLKSPAKKTRKNFSNIKNNLKPRATLQPPMLEELLIKLKENFNINNKSEHEFRIEVKKCEPKSENWSSNRELISLKKFPSMHESDVPEKNNNMGLNNYSFSSKSSIMSDESENSSLKTQLRKIEPIYKESQQKESRGLDSSLEKEKNEFIIKMKKCESVSGHSSDKEVEEGCICCSRHSNNSLNNTSGYSSCRNRKNSEITPLSTLNDEFCD